MTVAPDGRRVVFLRSGAGDDPTNRLWTLDPATGTETCVADPHALLEVDGPREETPEERLRRERARETAAGVVAYATDRKATTATFALAGQLCVANLVSGTARRHPLDARVVDPRPDPGGTLVAYVADRALHTVPVDGGAPTRLAGPERDEATVSWGLADFVAAEEMGRSRGFWWSPDGRRLAVARTDDAGVTRWHITEPADPHRAPTAIAYPAAGTANTSTEVYVVDRGGRRVRVDWEAATFCYLVDVVWEESGPLTLLVQTRDQRRTRILTVDPDDGSTRVAREDDDPHWVEIVPGVPRWRDGRLISTVDDADTRRVAVDGRPLSPPGLQVRAVVDVTDDAVVVAGSTEPTAVGAWRVPLDGGAATPLTEDTGVHAVRVGGAVTVTASRSLDEHGLRTVVRSPGGTQPIASLAQMPLLDPRVELTRLGERQLRAAVVLPRSARDDASLPVLLDPYGGPHAQRVLQARGAFLVPQWFAEAGFAVLLVDGRGSPARGPAWERAIAGDLVGPALEDQVDALHAAADRYPQLDLTRVAIRGWSFGGFLAAAAVLRRPDVFAAAVAGAPVTDWTLYDTHYTERYLGTPQDRPEAYRRNSLVDDASALRRPLLLVHGLADDNVVAAHTLRLSRALLAAGRPHRVLPLSGVTHMTPQTTVAENLLRLELDFLREALARR